MVSALWGTQNTSTDLTVSSSVSAAIGMGFNPNSTSREEDDAVDLAVWDAFCASLRPEEKTKWSKRHRELREIVQAGINSNKEYPDVFGNQSIDDAECS